MRSSLTAAALVSGRYLKLGIAISTQRRVAVVLAVLAMNIPSSASAQAGEMLGVRVRVQSSSQASTEGVVVEWGPTFLVLRTTERGLLLRGERSPVGRTLNLAWAEVTDVAQYHDRRRTVRGLILGGIAGAAAGGIIAAAVVGDVCRGVSGFCVGPESGAEAFAFGAVLGVLAGGAGGALIGTLINTSSWEPVVFPSVSLGLAAPRRVQLGVSLR